MLRIRGLDRNDPWIQPGHYFGDAAHVLGRVEQHAERRIADRPALDLLHRIIDEGKRLAVADDQDRHALFILEADLAGLFERQRAGQHLARTIGLAERRRHGLHALKMLLDQREIAADGRRRDHRGGGEHRQDHGFAKNHLNLLNQPVRAGPSCRKGRSSTTSRPRGRTHSATTRMRCMLWPERLEPALNRSTYKGFPSRSRSTSRRPTWSGRETMPSFSIRSINRAAEL